MHKHLLFTLTSLMLVLIGTIIVAAPTLFLLVSSIILIFQALITIGWMTYQWYDAETIETYKSPKQLLPAQRGFSILLPAEDEAAVISDTIRALNRINYPEALFEVLVICRSDDTTTRSVAETTISQLDSSNIRVVSFSDGPKTKSKNLNVGFEQAQFDTIGIFDAEDEPHLDILSIINTVMIRDQVDTVQAGIQLMNYRSNWFSSLNVLEYFFWFRSGIMLFNRLTGATPLGGNTVFFKRKSLELVDGWSEACLTEDALVGIQLAAQKQQISIVYDEAHVTQEETPPDIESFIKQRTRWQQGFLQILLSGEWLQLPKKRQRLLMLFLVSQPVWMASMFVILPINLLMSMWITVPVWMTMLTYIPLYFLGLILVLQTIGIFEFTRAYKKPLSFIDLLSLWFSFIPYLIVLGYASFRAAVRLIFDISGWEKTNHVNAHRQPAFSNQAIPPLSARGGQEGLDISI